MEQGATIYYNFEYFFKWYAKLTPLLTESTVFLAHVVAYTPSSVYMMVNVEFPFPIQFTERAFMLKRCEKMIDGSWNLMVISHPQLATIVNINT